MFVVLRDVLLFKEICHYFTTIIPLRLNATNYSFFKLSFHLLCTLQVVIAAGVTKYTQVLITWRCIAVDNKSRDLVVPSSRHYFILAPPQICGTFLIAFHLCEIFDQFLWFSLPCQILQPVKLNVAGQFRPMRLQQDVYRFRFFPVIN